MSKILDLLDFIGLAQKIVKKIMMQHHLVERCSGSDSNPANPNIHQNN